MWQGGGSQSFAADVAEQSFGHSTRHCLSWTFNFPVNKMQSGSDICPNDVSVINVRKPQNLLSACISQVLSSPDDSLNIGRVEANLENSEKQPMVEGIYCRMVGSVRSQEGSRYLMLLQVEPMTNANHLTEHLLAVIHNELAAHKPPAVNGNAAPTAGASTSGLPGAAVVKPEPGVGGGINQRSFTSEAGVGKADIVKNFHNEISPRQIDEALEFLCNEGQIYTTVDDDHYRSTEG
ncbi:hypothetical protein B566_EDAN008237 [Ephemera danica]|nr:hypothetical protein B566_EDAN008237 [Ephemera danica]